MHLSYEDEFGAAPLSGNGSDRLEVGNPSVDGTLELEWYQGLVLLRHDLRGPGEVATMELAEPWDRVEIRPSTSGPPIR